MECNKDEAIRAKIIAEKKMERNDYIGAKKFALKAQNLYPSLVGIAQMLTTIDVYISAENKISGEADWYGVLGVTPSMDDETLRKHYRKLVLVLHPDKNKSIGADGAFKLLSEAWSLLSDKSKRLAYNQRRSLSGFQQKVKAHNSGPSAPSWANGSQSSSSRSAATPKAKNTTAQAPRKVQKTTAKAARKARNTTAQAPLKAQDTTAKAPPKEKSTTAQAPLKTQNSTAKAPPKSQNTTARAPSKAFPTSFQQRSDTFWTICHRCKMHYEYARVFLNQVLLCPKCREAFQASETFPPSSQHKSSNSSSFQNNQGSSAQSSSGSLDPGINAPSINAPSSVPIGQSLSSNTGPQRGLPPRSAAGNSLDPSIGFTQAQGKVKREGDAINIHNSFSIGETPLKKSRVGTNEPPFGGNMDHQAAMENNGFGNFIPGSTKGETPLKKSRVGTNEPPFGGNMDHQAAMGNNGFGNFIPGSTKGETPLKKSRVGTNEHPFGENMDHQAAMGNNGFGNFSSESTKGETPLKKSRASTDEHPFGGNMDHQAAMGINVFGNFIPGSTKGVFYTSWVSGFPGSYQKPKWFRELTPAELRKMLMGKGQNEIQTKVNQWKSKIVTEAADVKNKNVEAAIQANCTNKQQNMIGIDTPSASKISDPVKNSRYGASDDANEGGLAAESMSVPDPDFHVFDLDRSESSFGDGEVWAAYDNDDGMPRYYAMISNVISRVPFKVRLGWLNSKTNNEFSTIDWVNSGFYKTCGEFRVGRYEVSNSLNSFSHKVKWVKGPRGTIHIFPKKGDVWALYSNWSPDWNEHTPDEVIHKYEMALVLDDYNEEQGILVAPLVKVAGFKTVFRQHMNPEKIKRIPKEEMFRFSHQVPNYFLMGEEVKNAPKDCQELDPAAIPVELFQVASEDVEGQVTNIHEDVKVMEMQSTAQVC